MGSSISGCVNRRLKDVSGWGEPAKVGYDGALLKASEIAVDLVSPPLRPAFPPKGSSMYPRRFLHTPARFLFTTLAALILVSSAFATTEKLLYSFQGSSDGVNPNAGLVADAAGNLYGTTAFGGTNAACSCGSVFELSPPTTTGGAWTETILYSFRGGNRDGERPMGTLTFDAQGNLYGTTLAGGANNPGTIFKLSPPATAGGAWTEKVLFVFPSDLSRGYGPQGKLVFDAAGNLYGSTQSGGSKCDCGTVFELKAPATTGGAWTHIVLYNFGPTTSDDGLYPSPDIIYRNGVIYGVTHSGFGTSQNGIVFQLVRKPGTWTENILYRFDGSESSRPEGGLVLDPAGNLYGATADGGSLNCPPGCGTIYELSPPTVAGGAWQETILYNFLAHGDGAYPSATLWRDSAGDLYGTASAGGIKNRQNNDVGGGTVFKLKAPASAGGTWTLAVLHDFSYPAADGSFPTGALMMFNGVFYSTTTFGGTPDYNDYGTVFSVVP